MANHAGVQVNFIAITSILSCSNLHDYQQLRSKIGLLFEVPIFKPITKFTLALVKFLTHHIINVWSNQYYKSYIQTSNLYARAGQAAHLLKKL